MMLSSAGSAAMPCAAAKLGVAAYLTKPVRQSELLDAILTALGTRAKNAGQACARHTPFSARKPESTAYLARRGQCRQPACRSSTARKRGHTVTVADNGKKALDSSGTKVLRPHADGRADAGDGWLGGDRRDPRKRKITGGHIPIIAMTAHAMKGDANAASLPAWTII